MILLWSHFVMLDLQYVLTKEDLPTSNKSWASDSISGMKCWICWGGRGLNDPHGNVTFSGQSCSGGSPNILKKKKNIIISTALNLYFVEFQTKLYGNGLHVVYIEDKNKVLWYSCVDKFGLMLACQLLTTKYFN